MQIGDLPRTRTHRERRDSAALQGLRILLVAGLMAGGSLALWLSGGSGFSAEGMVTAAPPQTVPSEPPKSEQPERAARVQVADADPAAPAFVPSTAPEPQVAPPTEPKDPARAPGAGAPVPLTSDQASAALQQAEAALEQPAPAVPAPPTDMDMTGTVTKQASLAEPSAPAGDPATTLVDLNKGSFEELNSLEGVGALGRAIIRGRPYKSVEDLVKKRVVRRSVYEKIKDQVTVQ